MLEYFELEKENRMKKGNTSIPAIVAETVGAVSGLAYIGLQIYYGIAYHVAVLNLVMNLLVAVLVYAGLTLLSVYPEKINGLSPEQCTGNVRTYSIRMVRLVKLVFIASLLIPCISDALGHEMRQGYSLIAIGLMLVTAGYYEYRIIQIFRSRKK